MLESFLKTLFSPGKFVPHGHCYLWQSDLVGLHIVADVGIVFAYYAIPLMLIHFARQRQDVPFRGIFLLFGAFIISCGTTHLMEIWTLWYPVYWLTGGIKLLTAGISLITAAEMVYLIPKALALPSPAQLEATNRALASQIAERERAETALKEVNAQLLQSLEHEERLKRITDRVRDSLDESQILQTAIQELGLGLGARGCTASSYDLEAGTATICYQYPDSEFSLKGKIARISEFPDVYTQLLRGELVEFCSLSPFMDEHTALVACPIVDDREVLGDLCLILAPDRTFGDREMRLVQQIANQCAIAIRQARLFQVVQTQVQELERLNQLKDDFLSTVSHELRTPMTNIKMAIEMLATVFKDGVHGDSTQSNGTARTVAQNGKSQKITKYFQVLRSECQREIALISDLLDLSRLEAGSTPLEISEIAPAPWLAAITDPFQDRAREHQQTLMLQLSEPLPSIWTDRSGLERIITELLNNACKYTPAGETIAVVADVVYLPNQCVLPTSQTHDDGFRSRLEPTTVTIAAVEEQPWIQIRISNSGIEIPEQERDRIFDKFYRIPQNDPWRHGGTGLGLALVKKLVERLSIEIFVESGNGQTTFVLRLPLRLDE